MAIITKIYDTAKKFSGRPLEITSKAMGFVTIGSVAYDSHINARENSIVSDRLNTADRFIQNYNNYISMEPRSQTIANMKNKFFDMQQTFTWPHIISRVTGYLGGFIDTLSSNLPEIALSILAIKTKSCKFLGKTAGVLLSINALKTILYDIIGFGRDKR